MKLINYLLLVGIFLAIFSACSNDDEPKNSISDVYILALDLVMEEDTALNYEMEYIAIDLSNFEHVKKRHKEEIFGYFEEKYQVKVMEKTYTEIREEGLYDAETSVLDGVLLTIDRFEMDSNNVQFEATKYRAGNGAIGVEFLFQYNDGEWEIKQYGFTFIS